MRKLLLTPRRPVHRRPSSRPAAATRSEAASGAAELVPAGAVDVRRGDARARGRPEGGDRLDPRQVPGRRAARASELKELIEKALRESDAPITFKEDIEPWLGDEAAFFASRPAADGEPQARRLLIATDDEDEARDGAREVGRGRGQAPRLQGRRVPHGRQRRRPARCSTASSCSGTERRRQGGDRHEQGRRRSSPTTRATRRRSRTRPRTGSGFFYLNSPQFVKRPRQTRRRACRSRSRSSSRSRSWRPSTPTTTASCSRRTSRGARADVRVRRPGQRPARPSCRATRGSRWRRPTSAS